MQWMGRLQLLSALVLGASLGYLAATSNSQTSNSPQANRIELTSAAGAADDSAELCPCIDMEGATVLAMAAGESASATAADSAKSPSEFHLGFSFSPQPVPGYKQVPADTAYSPERGYGFEPGSTVRIVEQSASNPLHAGHANSEKPFFFSADVPEGNYRVTLVLGDQQAESTTTVKAELRRLMLEQIHTAPGEFKALDSIVNVRRVKIAGGPDVKLKGRELNRGPGGEFPAWDDKLTLEFSGPHPAVAAIDIKKVDDLPTVYLCGDSTVCDQPAEPFNSWGQMITAFFKPTIAIANHAESGETTSAFIGERRWDKILSTLKAGDFVLVQFGHNDMKPNAVSLDRYKANFTRFVTDARAKGANPILLTPVSRESFDDAGKITNSFNGFPDAVREVAKEQNVPLIDLQNMSATLYEAIGNGKSQALFANTREKTHHGDYGSYEIAKCVAQAIADQKLPLAQYLRDDWKKFDPAHPDKLEDFKLPPDPLPTRPETPAGN